ncbi:FecR family protein [Methylosinus sp. LW4]|uniref:FecR family protein n=1 Tax=Methylosinus sp. LW4 TaxID=136993 RepID=UPI00036091BE|nr:FecR family protein [Methylosinus sp. LW4]
MRNLHGVALLALFGLCATNVRADVVGNVGAVNQAAQGTPPGGSAKGLTLGYGVVDRERIDTKTDGRAQIVFLDKSTLGVGANSSVTIDRFVYDAAAGAGKQSLSITKGALRFIGGEVSHGAGMEIKTPSATIAVRGGMVLVRVGGADCREIARAGGCDEIVLLNGVATIVTAKGRRIRLTRPGYGVVIGSGGEELSDPAPAGEASIEGFDGQFASLPGQTGGAGLGALPTGAQALAHLGSLREPDRTPWAGLGAIGAHWGAAGIAQSRAQTNNQTVATQTRQTLAAIVAAQNAARAVAGGGTGSSALTIDPGNPASGAVGALFANGFCVWGCVTPTFVSQSVSGTTTTITLRASFPGYGYFLIALSVDAASINYTAGQTSASFNGAFGATIVYYPQSGAAAQTNTYNFVINELLSWSGAVSANGAPTSFTVSGSDTLNFVNAAGIILEPPPTSTNAFFSLPNGFTQSFEFSYP